MSLCRSRAINEGFHGLSVGVGHNSCHYIPPALNSTHHYRLSRATRPWSALIGVAVLILTAYVRFIDLNVTLKRGRKRLGAPAMRAIGTVLPPDGAEVVNAHLLIRECFHHLEEAIELLDDGSIPFLCDHLITTAVDP